MPDELPAERHATAAAIPPAPDQARATRLSFEHATDAHQARLDAQRLAFGPILFQSVRVLQQSGVLGRLRHAPDGLTTTALQAVCDLSRYALTVLLEAALAAGVVECENLNAPASGASASPPAANADRAAATAPAEARWHLTRTGHFIERDPLTRTNVDFVADVCYRPMASLGAALHEGRPAGLAQIGPWRNVYEGLAQLPDAVRSSWFAFDHFYSDAGFAAVLPILAAAGPMHVADVGANTGRFAIAYLQKMAGTAARVTLCDLPQQLALARGELEAHGLLARAALHPCDVLAAGGGLPGAPGSAADAPDAFWMSQFICCFDEAQIVHIFTAAAAAVRPGGSIFVFDTFWDEQPTDIGALCLLSLSPYFAAIANGRGRMYRREIVVALARQAGLNVVASWSPLGWGHSLLKLQAADVACCCCVLTGLADAAR